DPGVGTDDSLERIDVPECSGARGRSTDDEQDVIGFVRRM
ncbi:MAG: hypothetical protein RLZ19_358, partial [Actinomycetota bacterium]